MRNSRCEAVTCSNARSTITKCIRCVADPHAKAAAIDSRCVIFATMAHHATGQVKCRTENPRAVRTRDLRENCSARVLENAAAEILQTVPKVTRLSHREKKSLNDNDICLAEREGFEPPIRLPVRRISSAVLSTTQPPLRGTGNTSRRYVNKAGQRSKGGARAVPRQSRAWRSAAAPVRPH